MKISTSIGAVLVMGLTLFGNLAGRGNGVVTDLTETDLRAAIAGGGTVTFTCDGTIFLTDAISITNDTFLDARGRKVTISGNGIVRVFQIHTNVWFSAENLGIAGGRAKTGAGLLNEGGYVQMTNCSFSANEVLGAALPTYPEFNGESVAGGAIANQGILELDHCSFSNNVASGGAANVTYNYVAGYPGGNATGGAVWNSGFLLANGCTFSENTATGGNGGQGSSGFPVGSSDGYPGGPGGDGAGAALFNCGTAHLVNCTLAFNTGRGGDGGPGGWGYQISPDYPPGADGPPGLPGSSIGGIDDVSGLCYLTNCTIAFNAGTGMATTETNGARLINTLLTGNVPDGDGSGNITDLGHNLSSDGTCGFTNSGSMNYTYALLGSLTNNGGSILTLSLLPGCWAIDAGDTTAAPLVDQRGVARPFGIAADIGAYEYDGTNELGSPKVVRECNEANLRSALSGGGRVTFDCNGIIVLASPVIISTDSMLDASDHEIVIEGSGSRLFEVGVNTAFSLDHVVLAGGSGTNGAGLYNDGGEVRATNCIFRENIAMQAGGAIENRSGEIWLYACVFTNNQVIALGYTYELSGCSREGGAIYNAGTLTADQCTFAGNSAVGRDGSPSSWYDEVGGFGGSAAGGAICNYGTVNISRSTFSFNVAVAGSGAAGHIGWHGEMGMDGTPGSNGGGAGGACGGALWNGGSARIVSSTFAFNSATGGHGGTGGDGGAASDTGTGGNAGQGGSGGSGVGALCNAGSLQVINSTFAFNSGFAGRGGTGGNGGGSFFGVAGAGGSGGNGMPGVGALWDLPGTTSRITNCTFAHNAGSGGMGGEAGAAGFGCYPSPTTGVPGTAGPVCGGIATSAGALINTILAANTPGNGVATIIDLGHNLSSDWTCGFTKPGSENFIDPKLGRLADNGGPTPTMALLPGSPAIDAGNGSACPPEDQRGLPRPIGAQVDIGAFEFGSPALLTLVPNTEGGFDINAIGQPLQSCWLLTSETLLEWQPISTNQFDLQGNTLFHVETGNGKAFFRLSIH